MPNRIDNRTPQREALGFPGRLAVEASAALLPALGVERVARGSTLRPVGYTIGVGPGMIRVRGFIEPGWEEPLPRWYDPPGDEQLRLDLPDDRFEREYEGSEFGGDEELERGGIREWSPRSRNRLRRAMCSIDWQPAMQPGTAWAMVTLTLPDDWRKVCPDGRKWQRLVGAFRRAWERDLAASLPELDGKRRLAAVWKREHQRRGAPHLHLGAPVPVGPVTVKRGRGRASRLESMSFHEWLSTTWARIVAAEGTDGFRHLLAGTAVDFREGSRFSDPKRLASYFVAHSAPGESSGKEYQHRLPDGWEHSGRWWGIWGLKGCTAQVGVRRRHAIEARRVLRAIGERQTGQELMGGTWVRVPRPAPATSVSVQRVDRVTGQIRRRKVRRRRKLMRGGGRQVWDTMHRPDDGGRFADLIPGGWVAVNDGPGVALDLARYLGKLS